MRDEHGRYYPKDPKHAEAAAHPYRGISDRSMQILLDHERHGKGGPILFVGGPQHGKLKLLPDWRPQWTVPIYEPQEAMVRFGDLDLGPDTYSYETAVYELKECTSAGGCHWFEYWCEGCTLPFDYANWPVKELELIDA